ncbi:MAG: FAD-dependent oxidoreductase [bacterium]
MKYELKREIPVCDGWDVIVAGGGPAGCAAATAAAREGAKTLLIEATGMLGGMGTSGLVPAWCPYTDKEQIIYRGIALEVLNECKAGMPHVKDTDVDWVPINHELLKSVYDKLVTGSGAEVLFFSQCVGVDRDDAGNINYLLVANKEGLKAYRASVVIDCTGDADLCAFAGADFDKGDNKGEMMPVTHCFELTNVDEYAYLNGVSLHNNNPDSPIWAIAQDPRFPLIKDTHACNNIVGPKTVGFNAGHLWDVDSTDPHSLSKAMIEGRELAAQFRDALAIYYPKAFANAFLVNTASLMGVRESRRIKGDYILTIDDWVARQSFPDEICRNSYFIDIHTAKNEVGESLLNKKDPTMTRAMHYGKGDSHGIPYRCLTPLKLRNVLVAGRSISTDRTVQGSTRVMPVCLAMGEAAGVAAAMAVKVGNDVREIDVNDLRAKLQQNGCYLP